MLQVNASSTKLSDSPFPLHAVGKTSNKITRIFGSINNCKSRPGRDDTPQKGPDHVSIPFGGGTNSDNKNTFARLESQR